jgi:hypothetical protein
MTWRSPRGLTLATALVAVVLFHVVSLTSGKLEVSGGRGWDGERYARMATIGLAEGTSNTRTRPLLTVAARIPYAFGLDIVASFQLLNYVYAFLLYLAAGLILDRYGAPGPVKVVVVANLALCIATSKMFAFYPVQIDLGALALTTLAFYFVCTDRRWLAGGACVLAAASREFGVAAAIYGVHRAIRQRRPAHETVLVYLPAAATTLLVRWWVLSTVTGDGAGPLTLQDAFANLRLWLSPAFMAAFGYFAAVLFGGISALLFLRPRWILERIREQPELGTYLLIFVALTAVGNLDIWRYLAFTLPAALVLTGQYFRGMDPDLARRILVAMTLITVVTQRPFEPMSTSTYFRDWFPLYAYFGDAAADLRDVWGVRLLSLALLMTGLSLTVRASWSARRVAV